jgi:hypothetical protein
MKTNTASQIEKLRDKVARDKGVRDLMIYFSKRKRDTDEVHLFEIGREMRTKYKMHYTPDERTQMLDFLVSIGLARVVKRDKQGRTDVVTFGYLSVISMGKIALNPKLAPEVEIAKKFQRLGSALLDGVSPFPATAPTQHPDTAHTHTVSAQAHLTPSINQEMRNITVSFELITGRQINFKLPPNLTNEEISDVVKQLQSGGTAAIAASKTKEIN